jgi:hypothetical protein
LPSIADNEAFYSRDDLGRYLPNPISRGPWNPNSLHGRVVIALLAHGIESRHGVEGFVPARLTVDMYRLPDFSPVEIATRVVRDGARIKVIDAEFMSNGVSQARATCQLLKVTEAPEGHVWSRPNWDVPKPDDIAEGRMGLDGMWAMKTIQGGFGGPGPRQTWISEVRTLVQGVPLTPFIRAAQVADIASPFAHYSSDRGLAYINTDVTLYLSRLPEGEWIGVETANHQARLGVAVGEVLFYDETGPLGFASCAALAQRREPRP